MTTLGKVCLWLSVIGLAVISVWLLPSVGKQHNEISAELQSSKTALDSAIESHRDQSQKLSERKHELNRLQIGWDKSWTVQPTANTGVKVSGGRLAVDGLGTESGLIPVLDDAGQPVQPAVHAFITMPEGVFYAGEFHAEQLDPTFCTLIPNWEVSADEVDLWTQNLQQPWRFRTLVPAAKRLNIDQHHEQLQKLSLLYEEIESNVAQQQASLEQAESELAARKQELLGDPNAVAIPGRPEFSEGLLRTISDEEDRRNDLLVEVDSLRRQVQEAKATRDELLRQLKEAAEQLASAKADLITRSEPGTR